MIGDSQAENWSKVDSLSMRQPSIRLCGETSPFHCAHERAGDRRVGPPALWMYSSVVDASVAVQRRRDMRVCPDPTHLFIDVLAKVGDVKDTTSVSEARISQVIS